jgi:hypothetical protein
MAQRNSLKTFGLLKIIPALAGQLCSHLAITSSLTGGGANNRHAGGRRPVVLSCRRSEPFGKDRIQCIGPNLITSDRQMKLILGDAVTQFAVFVGEFVVDVDVFDVRTVRKRCSIASKFFHDAQRRGLISLNPFDAVPKSNLATNHLAFIDAADALTVVAELPIYRMEIVVRAFPLG